MKHTIEISLNGTLIALFVAMIMASVSMVGNNDMYALIPLAASIIGLFFSLKNIVGLIMGG